MDRNLVFLLCIGAGLVLSAPAVAAEDAHAPAAKEGEAAKGKDGKPEEPQKDPRFLEQPAMVINIVPGKQGPNFVALRLILELADPADRGYVSQLTPRVSDYVMPYVRDLKVEAFRSSTGLEKLRSELLMRVNMATAPARVANVLFDEILFQ